MVALKHIFDIGLAVSQNPIWPPSETSKNVFLETVISCLIFKCNISRNAGIYSTFCIVNIAVILFITTQTQLYIHL